MAQRGAQLELIDPAVDAKHRSCLEGGQLHPALRLRSFDQCWTLDPRWIPKLRAAGLLPLVRMIDPYRHRNHRFPMDRALLTALADRWRPETHTFHLTIGEMAPTLEDVSMLLGLPIAGSVLFPAVVEPEWKQNILQRFHGVLPADANPPQREFNDSHGPTKTWLEQFRAERLTPNSEEWRVCRHLEAYLLWLFGWVMFTNTHQDSVDKHLIHFAQQIADADLVEVPQYSWGSAVLAATYRALCDACSRRSSAGSFTGCPLLLMLWSYERFDIGRPQLSSYEPYEDDMYRLDESGAHDPVDAPTMGSIWCKRDPSWATETIRRVYPQFVAFVASFDQLQPDRVRWTPYTEEVARRAPRGLSHLCFRDQRFWLTSRHLVYDICVEPYAVHRVLRQFGFSQLFPLPRQQLDASHMMTRKGQGIAFEATWTQKMQRWIDLWESAGTDVHVAAGAYDPSTYRDYLRWYHGATRWRCFPVPSAPQQRHEPEITDTFAMESPAVRHVLTEILDEVSSDLENFVSRLEANPPRVDREELAAGLRRLARRCREGLRHDRATSPNTSNEGDLSGWQINQQVPRAARRSRKSKTIFISDA